MDQKFHREDIELGLEEEYKYAGDVVGGANKETISGQRNNMYKVNGA